MELEFDKEIDALMRKVGREAGLEASLSSGHHLDADELSAFSENALPQKSHKALTLHLADCDSCRKSLSDVILMGRSTEPVLAQASAPARAVEIVVPWYKRLFAGPALAYVMGALILVFSGFLGYTLLEPRQGEVATEVSHVPDAPAITGGPNAEEELPDPAIGVSTNTTAQNTNAITATTANTAVASSSRADLARSVSNVNAIPDSYGERMGGAQPGNAAAPRPEVSTDAVTVTSTPVGIRRDEDKKAKDESALPAVKTVPPVATPAENRNQPLDSRVAVTDAPQLGAPIAKQRVVGPVREMQSQFPNTIVGNRASAAAVKRVGGKTFEYKQGVWYDAAYAGSATINVRRGTADYRKLDRGLRSISDSVGGTVVVVWKEKAYRIQ